MLLHRLEIMPEPPQQITDGAKHYWREIMPTIFELGTARGKDLQSVALLCAVLAQIDALQTKLEADGYVTTTAAGGYKRHPAALSLTDAREQARVLLDEFGLLPGSYVRPKPRYQSEQGYDD